jgi:hypothetical protein
LGLRREKRDESTTTATNMGECAPLLQQRVAARDGWEEKHCDDRDGARWWTDLAQEGGKVWRVALPMAAVSLPQYAVQVASNMMVGHLPGVLRLSASAIATSLATVSGFSLRVRELSTISFSTSFNFPRFRLNSTLRSRACYKKNPIYKRLVLTKQLI